MRLNGESYFVTTNATYVPATPIRSDVAVYLRADMRYGEDDPTQWPQSYSALFCHLSAIRKKPVGNKREIAIMWWDPVAEDLICPETGLTVTRGLGRLQSSRLAQLVAPIDKFLEQYKLCNPAVQKILAPLVLQVCLGLDRLQTLPSTFIQMHTGITSLQRNFLEAEGMLRYMTQFKPLMENPDSGLPPPVEQCVGVFTTEPFVAQQFRAAGLPYWLLRPTWTFQDTNILEVVEPLQPADHLQLEAAPGCTRFSTKNNMDSKVKIIQKCSCTVPWYKDPFASISTDESAALPASEAGPSGTRPPSLRFDPCKCTLSLLLMTKTDFLPDARPATGSGRCPPHRPTSTRVSFSTSQTTSPAHASASAQSGPSASTCNKFERLD
jgi:hypothetical protein